MQSLICPVCGASNSEFNSLCANCGVSLPDPSDATEVNGKHNRQAPPADGDDEDDELLPGQQISHFRILGRLGRGGMGEVYRALDLSPLNRVVALKFLQERRRPDLARLEREAQTAASLNDHPNIGTIYDFVEWKGRHFIVMALYDGETLAERLARQPDRKLPIPEATAIASQLANALQAAHTVHLVHRDLKPENVMILPDGRVKLIDFGLARWAGSPRLTKQGRAIGTIPYMAPEQFDWEKEAGPATDLWAWGVVLYEMLAGRHPFGGTGKAMIPSIVTEEPFPLHETRPEVPAVLEKIIERCLAKEPRERWPSAGDALAELEDSGLLGSGTIIPPARRAAWWTWIGATAAGLLLGLAISAYLWYRKPAVPLYVAVLKPEINGLQPDDQARVTDNLQDTLLRTVASLDGLAARDSAQVNQVRGKTVDVARAVAAGEVVTSVANCTGDFCHVNLERLDGEDGHVLWADTQAAPITSRLGFADAMAAKLRSGYSKRRQWVAQLALDIPETDYQEYLDLRRRILKEGGSDQALAEILSELEKLTKQAPSFVEAYFTGAKVARRLYEDTGNLDHLHRGLALALEAHRRAPKDPRPLQVLFELNLKALQLKEAGKAVEELNQIDPTESLLPRGLLAESRGDLRTALGLMKEAIDLQPSWPNLLTVANAEYRMSRYDAAKHHLEETLKRVPERRDGQLALAQIELLRHPDGAVAPLRELADKDNGPDSPTNLGTALMLLHDYTEAEKALRLAHDRQPGYPPASLNLADYLTIAGGPTAEAHKLYVSVVETRIATPGDWNLLAIKAQAHAHLGQKKEALEAIQRALHLSPENGQLEYEAAVVYVLIGDRGSALLYAQRAVAHNVNAKWFGLPFFVPLRNEASFQALARITP